MDNHFWKLKIFVVFQSPQTQKVHLYVYIWQLQHTYRYVFVCLQAIFLYCKIFWEFFSRISPSFYLVFNSFTYSLLSVVQFDQNLHHHESFGEHLTVSTFKSIHSMSEIIFQSLQIHLCNGEWTLCERYKGRDFYLGSIVFFSSSISSLLLKAVFKPSGLPTPNWNQTQGNVNKY